MSAVELASNPSMSRSSNRSRSRTSGKTGSSQLALAPVENNRLKYFEPCATTASMFLFAQDSAILCLHHDTLALERRFQRHTEPIVFIAVDNVSERGAGRQVVSYDAGQTAIVWDLFSGDEITRFASYDHLCAAAWLRNGNVAFGNVNGHVILFEPSTSEHVSARTINDPITAIAPTGDCRTYAIGYLNGSILIAAIQPSFNILHTLNSPRAPSPIVTLAWHASSAKQRSDMLAAQTEDGDLRVWSVAKAPNNQAPQVIRIVRKSDDYEPGANWLAWSKNGRIVQYSEGATFAWDVRTKNLTYEQVPTLDVVHGLALYGPTATLFTLGRNHTVQQFDLNPPTLVANKQHMPPLRIQSPPLLNLGRTAAKGDIKATGLTPTGQDQHRTLGSMQEDSELAAASPLQRIAEEMEHIEERRQDHRERRSPTSSTSKSIASSSGSSTGHRYKRSNVSASSRLPPSEGTQFSYGSSLASSHAGRSARGSAASVATSHRSKPRSSRLRQEVLWSPEKNNQVLDLFPLTRERLSDVPYKIPHVFDTSTQTAADLRCQMLSVVFGWNDDIEPLIEEELRGHQPGSPGAVLLSKWLNDVSIDMFASMTGSDTMNSSDWMLLALSTIGGQASTKKIGQAFVPRLLEKGDIHAAVTILLGLGEQNDAVEVYFSHHLLMEAVLLTCLVFPNDWQRISQLVRKWGEYAVKHRQQHLAIRCFSCTGAETEGVLTSPRAYDTINMDNLGTVVPRIVSPPLSTSGSKSGRIIAKNSSLKKLITSFDDKDMSSHSSTRSRFFGAGDGDRTPMNGVGVTPIIDSAISPGGPNVFLTPGLRSARQPESARTATPGGFARRRLPSIGETPVDVTPRAVVNPEPLPTPVDSGSDKEKEKLLHSNAPEDGGSRPQSTELLLSAATYHPGKGRQSPMPNIQTVMPMTANRDETIRLGSEVRPRNMSRDRKPENLHLQWPPMESIITGNYMSPGGKSVPDKARKSRPRADSSVHSPYSLRTESVASPLLTGNSLASNRSLAQSSKSMDRYISSLEEANFYAKRQRDESRRRQESRDRRHRQAEDDHRSRRGRSQDRSRTKVTQLEDTGSRYIKPAKRSPSSPVPMSPDELLNHSTDSYDDERYYGVTSPAVESRRQREEVRLRVGTSRTRGESQGPRTARRASPEREHGMRTSSRAGSKLSHRATSRRRSPVAGDEPTARGRAQQQTEGSFARSPSSPLPMSLQPRDRRPSDGDDAEELQAVEADRKRFRSRQRSSSRRPSEQRGASAVRNQSPDKRHVRDPSNSRRAHQRGTGNRSDPYESPDGLGRQVRSDRHDEGPETPPAPRRKLSERARKKELAAQELEERRQSLARRPSAPTIPHPEELLASKSPMTSRSIEFPGNPFMRVSPPFARSKTTAPESSPVVIGLPATPRAMRHPKYFGAEIKEDIPRVPEIPSRIQDTLHQDVFRQDRMDQSGRGFSPDPSPRSHRRSISVPMAQPVLPASLPTHPAFQRGLPPSSRHLELSTESDIHHAPMTARTMRPVEVDSETMGYQPTNKKKIPNGPAQTVMISIDENINTGHHGFDDDDDDDEDVIVVDASAPAPPLLPELRHLAQPPPPPPPPPTHVRPGLIHSKTAEVDASGLISIGIDGTSRNGVPIIDVPMRAQSAQPQSQSRERGTNDLFTGKFSRATQRIRSGSRNRNRSPPVPDQYYQRLAPYESVPPPPPPSIPTDIPARSQTTSPYLERHPREHRGFVSPEMPNNGFVEGGMI
ncbi:MAG: hypothetical protein M1816_001231 [Peltula sp. TS41687]|nr:MAG: hypothetical protein M1816_001231 [Peltula sp. TS41687]